MTTSNTKLYNVLLTAIVITLFATLVFTIVEYNEGTTTIKLIANDTIIDTEYSRPVLILVDVTDTDLTPDEPVPAPTPEPSRHIQITSQQRDDSLIVTLNGGKDIDLLRKLHILVNNEIITSYSPECRVSRTIECTTIGEWEVIIEGTFEDGYTQQLMFTRFSGLPEGYRTVSREEPGMVVTPVPTPVPTPILTPTPTGPISDIDEHGIERNPELAYLKYIHVSCIVDKSPWDDNIIYFVCLHNLRPILPDHIDIFIDGIPIASFSTTIIDTDEIEEMPMALKLPSDIDNSGEVTMVGRFTFSDTGYDELISDGEYPIDVCHRGMVPPDLREEYEDYPIYQG